MVRDILIWPDSRLKLVSKDVTPEDNVKGLAIDLYDTMMSKEGLGLAAIQVGVPLRMFAMEAIGEFEPAIIANPRILKVMGVPELVDEGCLSVPGFQDKVFRFPKIMFEARDTQTGSLYATIFDGLRAQVFQHEFEHLNGEIFLKHLPLETRKEVLKKLVKKGKKT